MYDLNLTSLKDVYQPDIIKYIYKSIMLNIYSAY